jgi:3-oxoacyl-(acyl-carrier-protein) synthase
VITKNRFTRRRQIASRTRSRLGPIEAGRVGAMADASHSSTKPAMGHLLDAAGSIEATTAQLALRDQVVLSTNNLDTPSQDTLAPIWSRQRPRVAVR